MFPTSNILLPIVYFILSKKQVISSSNDKLALLLESLSPAEVIKNNESEIAKIVLDEMRY